MRNLYPVGILNEFIAEIYHIAIQPAARLAYEPPVQRYFGLFVLLHALLPNATPSAKTQETIVILDLFENGLH